MPFLSNPVNFLVKLTMFSRCQPLHDPTKGYRPCLKPFGCLGVCIRDPKDNGYFVKYLLFLLIVYEIGFLDDENRFLFLGLG